MLRVHKVTSKILRSQHIYITLTTLTFNAYFNGSEWVETTIRDKITSLSVLDTLAPPNVKIW